MRWLLTFLLTIPAVAQVTVHGVKITGFQVDSGHSAALSWTQSSSPGVDGNKVYRGQTSGGPYTLVFTSVVPIIAYTDFAVTPGQWYYVVTATCSTCSPVESAFSTEASALVSGENQYCNSSDTVIGLPADGPADPLQACVYTAMSGSPSPGTVRTATNCADIATQLSSIANSSGDTLVIPASFGTCTGTWTVNYTGDSTHWLTIRTDQISNPSFPPEGTRADPCQINLTHIDGYPDLCAVPARRMPTLSSASTNTTTLTITGNHVRVIGIDITKAYGTSMAQPLIKLDGSDHVILDRIGFHGDNWDLHTPNFDTHIGLQTKCTYCALISSWGYDIDWNSADGYAIGGGTGTQPDEGPQKFYNNLLAGGSESFIYGGGAAAAVVHDLEIRRNLSMKPWKWFLAFNDAGPFGNFVNVKNLGEFKVMQRALLEENVFINNWEGQADQFGYAIVMLAKNQGYAIPVTGSTWANTNGTAVTCATGTGGTPCSAHAGWFGNVITFLTRAGGIVTLEGATNADWPNYNVAGHVVLQGIASQVVSGTNLNTFNGEWTMGCLNPTTCTNGFSNPNVLYFAAAGTDFPRTALVGGTPIAQDFTVQTCAQPGHCHMAIPKANYSHTRFASITDTEHAVSMEDQGIQTGQVAMYCHAGLDPDAIVQNITFRYNYISHSENIGLNIGNVSGPCLDTTQGVSQISIHDNVADDIDTVTHLQGPASGHGGSGPIVTNSYADPTLTPHDILLAHNTWAGLRQYKTVYNAQGGMEFTDPFNTVFNATFVQRISNVVTVTFAALSSVPPVYNFVTLSGFTGGQTDLNGLQTLTDNTDTTVIFTEAGSHADINPAVALTGSEQVTITPTSYYANSTVRDNIFAGPIRFSGHNQLVLVSSICTPETANVCVATSGIGMNLCSGATCSWLMKQNVIATDPYTGYAKPSAGYLASYPTTNSDGSSVCTVSGGCAPTDLSGVFTTWGNGLGNTSANNYSVTTNYQNAGTDGKNIGADITHFNLVKAAVLPHFTYQSLTISTAFLTACTNNVYCEQQLLTSSSAGKTATYGKPGWVMWHLTSGTLPTGMSFTTFDNGGNNCQVQGTYSKNGSTGCAGWLWGTPTQTGSFALQFQAEDAGHQQANVSLTLTVNP